MKSAERGRRVWWPAFALAAMGVLALLAAPQARSVGAPTAPSTVQPGPVGKPALRAIVEEETRRRARAPRADKAALRAARAQAATAPPAPAAAPAPPTGIIDDVQGALPTSTDRLLNAWQGEVDGRLVAVYAGARAGDGAQGVVVVVTLEGGNGARFSQRALATPSRSGAVRVVAAHAPLVTLRATSGATFTLDVTARRFR
ncbi:MAG TPA: hypothetical protein VHM23_30020 [Actinomycetota bacterium]|jgi:hypothetical protein|nr:hypothetical protein [Actinomycetota bacterium]